MADKNRYFLIGMIVASLMFLICVLCIPASSYAADVTVAWDANDSSEQVEGYRVFYRLVTDIGYDYGNPAWQGPGTTCTLSGAVPGTTYALVVRAYRGANESADSNEVVYTPPVDQQVIVYPAQPKSITIRFGD
jgi:hypothetical protein